MICGWCWRGVKTKTALFTMRLSFSGRAAHRAFATQGQEAFLEGHVYGFDRLGGVPVDKIRYDNLNSAVKQVLFGRSRQENERWIAFRSHYGFEAWYCQPGHEGSHEKGGVEGEGGRFRRNHCVPMPVVDSIEELNAVLAAADDADDHRRIANRANSVGQDWEFEKTAAAAGHRRAVRYRVDGDPAGGPVRADHGALQSVLGAGPVHWPSAAGETVGLARSPSMTAPRWWRAISARSARAPKSWIWTTIWRSWLRKPGALPGATALAQARAAKMFTAEHDAWWAAARKAHGDAAGTRVLWSRCCCCTATWTASMCSPASAQRCRSGSTSADVVALEARKAAERRGAAAACGMGQHERRTCGDPGRASLGRRARR